MKIPQQHIDQAESNKHAVMQIYLPEVCTFKFQPPYSREALLIIDHLKTMNASDRIKKSTNKKAV